MFIIFHQLPLMAMFVLILSMSVLVCWLLIGLVRFTVPRLGYRLDEPLPIRDSIINASGALFALMVAFSAAGIWNDAVAARNAVQREADAVESVMVLSAVLPDASRTALHENLRAYLQGVIAIDWPAMAVSMPLDNPVFDQSEKHLLGAIESVSRQDAALADASTYAPLLNQLLQIRHARLARLTSSQAGVTWAQWFSMWLISTATLLAIIICNSHAFRMQVVAAHLYVFVISAAYFVVLAHDRPFVGKISVQPTALQALIRH
ncbi:bestrophin-like domain [Bosea thiooxidans]